MIKLKIYVMFFYIFLLFCISCDGVNSDGNARDPTQISQIQPTNIVYMSSTWLYLTHESHRIANKILPPLLCTIKFKKRNS